MPAIMNSIPALRKVGECLYRNHKGTYFALIKVRGKQIRRSLNTDDLQLAKRSLAKFQADAVGLASEGNGMLYDHLKTRWLESRKPESEPSSFTRLGSALKGVDKFFRGQPVRKIGNSQVEAWKIARSNDVSARTLNYEREVLIQLFNYAREELRIIIDNPMAGVKKRKAVRTAPEIPGKPNSPRSCNP